MDEALGHDSCEPPKPLHTGFKMEIGNFPESERAVALEMVEIYQRNATSPKRREGFDLISTYLRRLLEEKGEGLRRCKLYHLLTGSSLLPVEWNEFPLDTPDHDLENFMRGSLSELINS